MIDARLAAAVAAGKLAGLLSRRLRLGGGTTFPGALATRIDARLLAKLSSDLTMGSVVVTGTNGKTTTSRLIANIFREAGWRPVHNRAGANLLSGLATALVDHSGLLPLPALAQGTPSRRSDTRRPSKEVGLFEVDEAVMPAAVAAIQPRVVLITNLFRDQLDRYGELDYLARIWREALRRLSPESTVILNADDPLVAQLGEGLAARVLYYGLEDPAHAGDTLEHAADSKTCSACAAPLIYDAVFYGHLGHYRCPDGHVVRPATDVAATRVESGPEDPSGLRLALRLSDDTLTVRFPLPGLYNVYNALAAISAASSFGIEQQSIVRGVESFSAAFGRLERIPVDGRTVFLALVKNPVGFNQVLRTLFDQPGASSRGAVILINDNFADGTDISWLWDVDFERLAGRVDWVICGGTRGEDMQVRLKYAGVEPERLRLVKDLAEALDAGLAATAPGETLYVMPSYTAMLDARAVLAERAGVGGFWEN